MSLESVIIGFVLALVCAGFVTLFMRAFYKQRFTHALIFKGAASLCFVVFGAINCFCNSCNPTTVLIFIALCLGIIGDEVIALCQVFPERDTLAFLGGGSFFIVGHVLYIISLFLLGGVNWLSLVLSFLIIASIGLVYEGRRKFLRGDMKVQLALYLRVVVFFAAVAIGVFVKRLTLGAGLVVLGGICFAVSDNVLFAYKLSDKRYFGQNIILHLTYYVAQFAIAWGMAFL